MKWLDKLIVSERGLWDNPDEPVVVPTENGNITMKADPKTGKKIEGPVFAIDNTGYSQMMYPGGEYRFPGNMVYEIPMAQYGNQIKKSIVSAEELPEDAFPYEGTSAMFKDERYNIDRAKKLYTEDEFGHLPSIDYETGEWLKAKRYPTSWKEFLQYTLNPEVNKLGFPTENKEGFLRYPNYANGGDISIPDLSRPNWLDKAQKGQQVKYYDDYSEYLKAAKAEADSSAAYKRDKNFYESTNNYTLNSLFPYEDILTVVDLNEKAYGHRISGYSPKPKVKPVYKEKPKEYVPTKTPRLEREPLQLVMPQSDRTLMPYNNTLQVLRSVQQEDRNKQVPKVVPAPEFQKGGVHQKIYTDLPQFEIANQNYNDSLIVHNALKDIENAYYSNVAPLMSKAKTRDDITKAIEVSKNLQKTFPKKALESKERLVTRNGLVLDDYAFEYPDGNVVGPAYSSLDKPTQIPVYIAETRKDPYMPPSNTAEVLSQIKQEDLRKQGRKNVPAPIFRMGGWLDMYQDGSQVAANLPWINQSGQYKDPTGIGPTVGKAEELKQKKLIEAARNSPSGKLPSGAITPVMGPVEYALMGPAAASTIRAAAPIVGSALNTSIGLPGATAGNALGAMGAADALVNRFPQIPEQLSRGEYLDAAINAGTGALDLYGANMVSPLFKGAKASKAATSTKTGYSLRDIKNATSGLGSTDDEAIAAIEAIRSRKLSSWKTPEGRRRLQKLIDENPYSFRVNHPLKNETPDTFIKRMENLINLNVDVKNIKEELPKLREQIMGYHKNMNEIDEAFSNNRISADDYFNMQADLDDKLQRLGSKHDELYLKTNSNYSAFLETDPYTQKAFINPELLVSGDLFPVAAHEVSGHSLSSFGKGSIPTYLDKQLGGLRLKNAKDETIDAVTGLKPKGESNLFYHANYPGSLNDNQDYWLSGSSGTERVPFVTEVKEDMLTKGIIKNDYDPITPEMLQKHYNTYMSKAGEKYPLRVYDIMEENPENFNLLSKVLNDLPSFAAPLTIAAGSAAAMKKEKYGGWLDNY